MIADDNTRLQVRPSTPLPWEVFRQCGFLALVNTAVFHPRGWAISFLYPDGTDRDEILAGNIEPIAWTLEGDGAERWSYGCDDATRSMLDELWRRANLLLANTQLVHDAALDLIDGAQTPGNDG